MVCQASVPLNELLQAAGITGRRGGSGGATSSSTSTPDNPDDPSPPGGTGRAQAEAPERGLRERAVAAVRGIHSALTSKAPYDPEFWPRGRVAIKASASLEGLNASTRMLFDGGSRCLDASFTLLF